MPSWWWPVRPAPRLRQRRCPLDRSRLRNPPATAPRAQPRESWSPARNYTSPSRPGEAHGLVVPQFEHDSSGASIASIRWGRLSLPQRAESALMSAKSPRRRHSHKPGPQTGGHATAGRAALSPPAHAPACRLGGSRSAAAPRESASASCSSSRASAMPASLARSCARGFDRHASSPHANYAPGRRP